MRRTPASTLTQQRTVSWSELQLPSPISTSCALQRQAQLNRVIMDYTAAQSMNAPVIVQIVGTPVACATGVKDTWREIAAWAGAHWKH